MENCEIKSYYNTFSKHQQKIGLNIRHREIIFRLKKAGLKKNHIVLELGCGIGIISGTLSTFLTRGKIVGVDISDESIRIAQKRHLKKKNVEFICAEIRNQDFNLLFDVIVLPDVLEHIPLENHFELFQKLSKILKTNGFIFIHIPRSSYIEYLKVHKPDLLQKIDQSIMPNVIVKNAENAGLELIEFKTYSLSVYEKEYSQIIFKHKENLTSVKNISRLLNIWKEVFFRIRDLRFFQ